jgi:hypothetical protein
MPFASADRRSSASYRIEPPLNGGNASYKTDQRIDDEYPAEDNEAYKEIK